ncbi:hypothetical protein ACFOWM_01820 [Ferruginibacter yonginensis]|uniref:Uncharacterized protein n=1 Tax=Ferruginibacter yonginensis TaxID=1310416 RepID=A0ABV8QRE5_9BACT
MTLKEPALANNLPYLSPIRLLQHCDIEIDTIPNVSRLKKQLNAEFDLANGGVIEIDKYAYNKSDVLTEIEHPDFATRYTYHQRIWERKFLLTFLEDNLLNMSELEPDLRHFANDDYFEHFISSYFGIAFYQVSRALLNPPSLNELADLLRCEDFIKAEDRSDAFKAIRIYLDDTMRILKNSNAQSYRSNRPQLVLWMYGGGNFLNNLPVEFYEDKADVVLNFINLTVRIQKTDRNDCKEISNQLIIVDDLPDDLRTLIKNNHQVFHNIPQPGASSSSGNVNWGWIIWLILILARILVRC